MQGRKEKLIINLLLWETLFKKKNEMRNSIITL